jgi:hypothetical protein
MAPSLACCPKLVAGTAFLLLAAACIMLAMDTIYLEDSFTPGRPAAGYFLQPAWVGVIQYTTSGHDLSYTSAGKDDRTISSVNQSFSDLLYVINDYGANINLSLRADRQREAPASELKYILHWNEAYGNKMYGFGFGREPFYAHRCPETRCITTDDRDMVELKRTFFVCFSIF